MMRKGGKIDQYTYLVPVSRLVFFLLQEQISHQNVENLDICVHEKGLVCMKSDEET